jgi:UDP-N-acetylmuramate--alanine ligase
VENGKTIKMNLKDIKKVYFIGIGGIGMSAIARYFHERAVEVYGYDKTSTVLTRNLEAEGMKIHYEDKVSLIPENIDLVVWTPAIKDLKELEFFKKSSIPMKKRAEVLGIISQGMKCVAIGGTHGKTTTSALTAHLLKVGELDNVALLGGIAENYQSNYISGKGEWVVVEADEFDRSFLWLHPDIAVVTSMDADHLDIYGTDEEIKKSFHQFANQTKEGGVVFTKPELPLNIDSRDVRKITYEVSLEVKNKSKSTSEKATTTQKAMFFSKNLRSKNGFFAFDFYSPTHKILNLEYTQPGIHNVENATVAVAIALELGVTEEKIREGLQTFKGIKRRFDFVVKNENIVYIDDYAHHPTELNAAIASARMLYPKKKILGIFQPHLYSRTNDFQDGFAASLDKLDEILLMDIYPARELPMEGVTSKIIFDKMQNANKQQVTKENLLEILKLCKYDVILTLGAGDIDLFVKPIEELLINNY